jgi:hypothetical protein
MEYETTYIKHYKTTSQLTFQHFGSWRNLSFSVTSETQADTAREQVLKTTPVGNLAKPASISLASCAAISIK